MRAVRNVFLFLFLITLSMRSWPCGPQFAPYYLVFGNESLVLDLPRKALGDVRSLPVGWSAGAPWEASLDIDLAQLREALGSGATDDLIAAYRAARTSARATYEARMASTPHWRDHAPRARDTVSRRTVHADRVAGIPREFALYLRGTQAYYRQDYARAIARWSQILHLPESERQYRSTWAAFMIGKAYLYVDPRSAVCFFEETRRLAASAYPDPLELADASIGWQANAEERLGHHFEAARLYGARDDFLSQQRAIARAFAEPDVDERFFRDPFLQYHALAILELGGAGREHSLRTYQRASEVLPESVLGLPGRMAHSFYRQGDFEAAADWVDIAVPEDPNARWVESKLMLRDGQIEAAMVKLHELVAEFPSFTASIGPWYEEGYGPSANPLCSDLGVLHLGREQFVESMDMLARGGFLADAAYVAECVLTPNELRDYLKQHAGDVTLRERTEPSWADTPMSVYDYLTYLYARRLARAGKWNDAVAFFPDTAMTPFRRNSRSSGVTALVSEIAERIVALQKPASSSDVVVAARMETATLMRNHGMELMGTECGPDWTLVGGMLVSWLEPDHPPHRIRTQGDVQRPTRDEARYDVDGRVAQVSPITLGLLNASQNESQRYSSSRPKPNLPFHYRYRAADLMWEAASQLPNNDTRTAQALWYGGTWLASRDPKAADRFYKALVRRCRKLPIGREADASRWFPPMPEEWKLTEGGQ